MQLNWLRAGCASIAECGEYTVNVFKVGTEWNGEIRNASGHKVNEFGFRDRIDTREAAEAACQAWLDQFDKPVWHDVTEWLSYAEWRGWRLQVCSSRNRRGMWCWYGSMAHPVSHTPQGIWIDTRDEAKAASEKYVREQTGGAA